MVYIFGVLTAVRSYNVRRIWVSDGFNTTEFLCTAGNNEIIFVSSSNQATVYFTVAGHRTLPAKGFWLLYKGLLHLDIS